MDGYFKNDDYIIFQDNALKQNDDMEVLIRLGRMFNVTTHETSDGKELRLMSAEALISIRYGTDPQQERHRLLKHAHKRAVERAWESERALVAAGSKGARAEWNAEEREELVNRGRVDGYEGQDIHDVSGRRPQLADDPANIRFHKTSSRKKRNRRTHYKKNAKDE